MTFDQVRADFWGWGAHTPTESRVIRNRSVELTSADEDQAILAARNDWMIGEELVLEEALQITVREHQPAYGVDMDFTLTPRINVTLDPSAFGGFCVKGLQDGDGAFYSPAGRVNLPAPHHMKPESNWPPVPCYNDVIRLKEGPIVGVAVMSHSENLPTRWHNVAGMARNNPCIVALGPVTRPAHQPQRLRCRLIVHDGPSPAQWLNSLSEGWWTGSTCTIGG